MTTRGITIGRPATSDSKPCMKRTPSHKSRDVQQSPLPPPTRTSAAGKVAPVHNAEPDPCPMAQRSCSSLLSKRTGTDAGAAAFASASASAWPPAGASDAADQSWTAPCSGLPIQLLRFFARRLLPPAAPGRPPSPTGCPCWSPALRQHWATPQPALRTHNSRLLTAQRPRRLASARPATAPPMCLLTAPTPRLVAQVSALPSTAPRRRTTPVPRVRAASPPSTTQLRAPTEGVTCAAARLRSRPPIIAATAARPCGHRRQAYA